MTPGNDASNSKPNNKHVTGTALPEPHRPTKPHDRGGDGASQARSQEEDALAQMGADATLSINEGGRTNDSHAQDNPEGAVHGLPQPSLKGTWR